MGTEIHFGKNFIRCSECSNLIDFEHCNPVNPKSGNSYENDLLSMEEIEHLRWVINRLISVYGEDYNTDYIIRAEQILKSVKKAI